MLAFALSHFILLHFPVEACLFSNGRQTWGRYSWRRATGKCRLKGIHNQDLLYEKKVILDKSNKRKI